MATAYFEARKGVLPSRPDQRGYHVVYRDHEENHCPGCGRSHWLIGRLLAECAFCETALPLENAAIAGNQIRHSRRTGIYDQAIAA